MAMPTISNNSPSAGYISWSAFGIQYDGQSFSIPSGNSNKKFIWWVYNGGVTPALMDGDALPTLGNDDMILFLNKTGFGVLVPTAEVLDGSLIVNGSILAAGISANAIQTYHLSANVVTATQIAADAVQAGHVSAGAITTDKLSVGSVGDSLVTNGSFEEYAAGMPIGWTGSVSGGAGSVDIVTGVASSGANAARLIAGATTSTVVLRQVSSRFIPVTSAANRKWYIAAMVGAGTATTKGFYLRAAWYDANKAYLSYNDALSDRPVTTTFQQFEGQVTPPANARYMCVEIYLATPNVITNMYVDEVVAREVVIAAQIGDGAITAQKILANTITGDRIAAKAITADKLTVSDYTNYAPDPGFELGGIGWNTTGWTIATIADPPVTGTKALQTTGSGAVKDAGADLIPVRDGDWYYASAYVRKVGGTGGTVGTVQLAATVNRTAGGPTYPAFQSVGASTLTNAWTKIGGAILIPPLATTMQIRATVRNDVLNGTYQFDDVQLRRMSGGELIVDGAVIATKIATDAVTADKIQALAITAGKIAANAVEADTIKAGAVTATKLESKLILASTIIAGPEMGTHAQMDAQGFRVFAADTDDGIPNEVVRMGVAASDDYFAITKANNEVVAAISSQGVMAGAQVWAKDNLVYRGTEMATLLGQMPQGVVAAAYRDTYSSVNATPSGAIPFLRLEVTMKPGRLYKVWTSPIKAGLDVNAGALVGIKYTVGATATMASGSLTEGYIWDDLSTVSLSELFTVGSTTTVSFLIWMGSVGGAAGFRPWAGQPVRLVVEDVGAMSNNIANGVHMNGVAAPAPAKNTYIRQYAATTSQNYTGSNTLYNYDLGHMYQGFSPAGQGNLKSIAIFGGNTTDGASMVSDLSGATVNYVKVYLNFPHWYYNAGGTAQIGCHGHSAVPGSFSGSGIAVYSAGWPKPGARWVDLPSSVFAGFKDGTYKGVYLEGDGSYGTYGYADRPTIEIGYTK